MSSQSVSNTGLKVDPVIINKEETEGSSSGFFLFDLILSFLGWIASIFCSPSNMDDREVVEMTRAEPPKSPSFLATPKAAETFRQTFPSVADADPTYTDAHTRVTERAEKFVRLVDKYIDAFGRKDVKKVNQLNISIAKGLEWLNNMNDELTSNAKAIAEPALKKLDNFEKKIIRDVNKFASAIGNENLALSKLTTLDSESLKEYRLLFDKIMQELSFINQIENPSFMSKNAIAKILKEPLETFAKHLDRLHTPARVTKELKIQIKQLFEKQALVTSANAGIASL